MGSFGEQLLVFVEKNGSLIDNLVVMTPTTINNFFNFIEKHSSFSPEHRALLQNNKINLLTSYSGILVCCSELNRILSQTLNKNSFPDESDKTYSKLVLERCGESIRKLLSNIDWYVSMFFKQAATQDFDVYDKMRKFKMFLQDTLCFQIITRMIVVYHSLLNNRKDDTILSTIYNNDQMRSMIEQTELSHLLSKINLS